MFFPSCVLILVLASVEANFHFDKNLLPANGDLKGQFVSVLKELRTYGDKQLLSIFPTMKTRLVNFHKYVDQCYDKTVENNITVNIFKDKVENIAKKYFVSIYLVSLNNFYLKQFFILEKSVSSNETFQP